MAEDGIKIDYAQVAAKATSIRNILDRINQKFSTMKSQVENLPSSWTGDEADRFKTKIDAFVANFDKFSAEMESCVVSLEEVSSKYSKLEEEILNSISAIQ